MSGVTETIDMEHITKGYQVKPKKETANFLFVQIYCDMNEICTHNSYFLNALSYSVKAVN